MAILLTVATVFLSAVLAAPLGGFLSIIGGWGAYPWLGPLLAFIALFMIISAMFGGLRATLSLAGGGLWSTSPARWVVGKLAFLILAIPPFIVALIIMQLIGFGFGWMFFAPMHPAVFFIPGFNWSVVPLTGWAWFNEVIVAPWVRLSIFCFVIGCVFGSVKYEKRIVAYVTLPIRNIWRALKSGLGGSAAFDGLLDEWLMAWKPGQVILGASLYEPGQRLGKRDDRHLLTIASTRSGKGRSCIIPNLLTWPGSVLVIDPKGENAAVTAIARRKMGQEIHILDPFGLLAELGLDPAHYPVERFNPLTAIDVNDIDVVEQIGNLADALIIHSEQANPFWDNASKAVLAGVIAHVLAWPKLQDSERHLGTVRDYISETNGRKLSDMAGHAGVANLTAVAVSELKRASDSAGGDILTTLATHVKWLDSLAMRKAMAASDFDLATLKHKQASLYLVIPPDYLKEHARFMRLFITLALRAAGRGVKAKHPMLFIMDEFATLGPLKVVEEAAGLLAGGGVRLWPIIQNLTQLRMYGDNWEVFLANAGQTQLFAVNDQTTARYFSEKMDHHMSWRKVKSAGGGWEWVPQGATWFRTSAELARESSRDSGRALVFYEGGRQAVVRRPAYDKIFKIWDYEPNPYQAQRISPVKYLMTVLQRDGAEMAFWELVGAGWRKPARTSQPVPETKMPPEPAPYTPSPYTGPPPFLKPVEQLQTDSMEQGSAVSLTPKKAKPRKRAPKKPTI